MCFISVLAHEIRSPLASLQTSLNILKRTAAGTQRDRLLATMEGRINQMAQVLNRLLGISKPEPTGNVAVRG